MFQRIVSRITCRRPRLLRTILLALYMNGRKMHAIPYQNPVIVRVMLLDMHTIPPWLAIFVTLPISSENFSSPHVFVSRSCTGRRGLAGWLWHRNDRNPMLARPADPCQAQSRTARFCALHFPTRRLSPLLLPGRCCCFWFSLPCSVVT